MPSSDSKHALFSQGAAHPEEQVDPSASSIGNSDDQQSQSQTQTAHSETAVSASSNLSVVPDEDDEGNASTDANADNSTCTNSGTNEINPRSSSPTEASPRRPGFEPNRRSSRTLSTRTGTTSDSSRVGAFHVQPYQDPVRRIASGGTARSNDTLESWMAADIGAAISRRDSLEQSRASARRSSRSVDPGVVEHSSPEEFASNGSGTESTASQEGDVEAVPIEHPSVGLPAVEAVVVAELDDGTVSLANSLAKAEEKEERNRKRRFWTGFAIVGILAVALAVGLGLGLGLGSNQAGVSDEQAVSNESLIQSIPMKLSDETSNIRWELSPESLALALPAGPPSKDGNSPPNLVRNFAVAAPELGEVHVYRSVFNGAAGCVGGYVERSRIKIGPPRHPVTDILSAAVGSASPENRNSMTVDSGVSGENWAVAYNGESVRVYVSATVEKKKHFIADQIPAAVTTTSDRSQDLEGKDSGADTDAGARSAVSSRSGEDRRSLLRRQEEEIEKGSVEAVEMPVSSDPITSKEEQQGTHHDNNTSEWVRRGPTILRDDSQIRDFGMGSMAYSPNGPWLTPADRFRSRIIVGSSSGHARVYRLILNGTVWERIDDGMLDMDGQDDVVVAIAGAGTRFAVGYPKAGRVAVYDFTDFSSSQDAASAGPKIVLLDEVYSEYPDEGFGSSLAFDAFGSFLVVGTQGEGRAYTYYFQVFRASGLEKIYPLADPIELTAKGTVSVGTGRIVKHNSGCLTCPFQLDEFRIIVGDESYDGGRGRAIVYQFDNTAKKWEIFGNVIEGGEGGDRMGQVVSMSPDMAAIAVSNARGEVHTFALGEAEVCSY